MEKAKRRCALRTCAFSPCGTLVCTGGYDNVATIVRVSDGTTVVAIEREAPVWACCWSPNATRVVIGGMDKKIAVVDVSGTVLHETSRDQWIYGVDWSPGVGKWLAVGGMASGEATKALVVVEARSSGVVERDLDGASVWCVRFSPDARRLACGTSDGRVVVFSPDGKNKFFEVRRGRDVYCVAFSPDGQCLACGSDATVSVLDASLGTLVFEFAATSKVLACAFAGPTSLLVGGWNTLEVSVLDFDTAVRCSTLPLPKDAPVTRPPDHAPGRVGVTAVAVSPDSRVVAFARTDGVFGLTVFPDRTPSVAGDFLPPRVDYDYQHQLQLRGGGYHYHTAPYVPRFLAQASAPAWPSTTTVPSSSLSSPAAAATREHPPPLENNNNNNNNQRRRRRGPSFTPPPHYLHPPPR
ncbi:hypothetical protein CTAYLR_000093 [Chrysophaeum taylorii]|uniref:Anaphase-promoting complex subunit 4 WD40 domain-containing protein n=1 Tax=Chrysophaeum taylorii TaxID=2483200 RepID=A0AAD7XNA5_9STRA|nr:hypothetical protein CTAYLR_000093 [Chrysophaeum taylorii]